MRWDHRDSSPRDAVAQGEPTGTRATAAEEAHGLVRLGTPPRRRLLGNCRYSGGDEQIGVWTACSPCGPRARGADGAPLGAVRPARAALRATSSGAGQRRGWTGVSSRRSGRPIGAAGPERPCRRNAGGVAGRPRRIESAAKEPATVRAAVVIRFGRVAADRADRGGSSVRTRDAAGPGDGRGTEGCPPRHLVAR